ncbi:MAG TPA: hypothetical protein DCP28_23090 [Cytophagales bacterium]|nr:hypothetical protein [Cytophagales bacterium]
MALCFVGATIFWFFNSLGKDYTTRINYPIDFLYSTQGTMVVGDLPRSVELNVTGGGWTLLQHTLNPSRFPTLSFLLEAPTSTQYLTRSDIQKEATENLKAFTLNYVLTDSLHFLIEDISFRTVTLAVDEEQFVYDDNYRRTGDIILEPDTLRITGPRSQVESLQDTLWIPLELDDIDEAVTENIDVEFLPSEYMTTSVSEIQVSFPVVEFIPVRRSIPIETVGFPSDSSLYLADSMVSVLFWMPEGEVAEYDSLKITALVSAQELLPTDTLALPLLTVEGSPDDNFQAVPERIRVIRPDYE